MTGTPEAPAATPPRAGAPAATLHDGRAEDVYDEWDRPDLIVSDGAYGLEAFPGDPPTPDGLDAWYADHAAAWSRRAHPATTLWFWNTEIGWATAHPVLAANGWEYVQTIVWNKGIRHVAGRFDGRRMRRLPTVTEICVFYRRRLTFRCADGTTLSAQAWMRSEWERAGLPLGRADAACGVASAATRRYLTRDRSWRFPPPAAIRRLTEYANREGRPGGRPYYSLDGERPVTPAEWAGLRHPWNQEQGLTNVWSHPPLRGAERYRASRSGSDAQEHNREQNVTAHLNQKPLELMRRIVCAASNPGDTIWEPFGGLCSATATCIREGRRAFAAEPDPYFAGLARQRLAEAASSAS